MHSILSQDGETDFFKVKARVLQGDTFEPFLFIIVLNYMLSISIDNMEEKSFLLKPRQSSHHPKQYLTNLDFADNLELISKPIKVLELFPE